MHSAKGIIVIFVTFALCACGEENGGGGSAEVQVDPT